jgi:hypothetical protein
VIRCSQATREVGRVRYFWLAVGTIALGLSVHLRGGACRRPRRRTVGVDGGVAHGCGRAGNPAPLACGGAVGFCFAVEFSQLFHLPALDALRRTTAGHLALGSGFDPRDFVSYATGVLAAVLLERATPRGGLRPAISPRTGSR